LVSGDGLSACDPQFSAPVALRHLPALGTLSSGRGRGVARAPLRRIAG